MSYKLFVKAGAPFQVDGFDKDSKRTVVGSLHFKPNSILTITNDEWEKVKNDGYERSFNIIEVNEEKEEVQKISFEEKVFDDETLKKVSYPPVNEKEAASSTPKNKKKKQ